jgi:hypothetical protein
MVASELVYNADYPWADTRFQFAVSVAIALVMYFVQDYLAEPHLARYIAAYPKKSKRDDHKWPGIVCNFVMHVPVAIITYMIVVGGDWYSDPAEKVWKDFPHQPQPVLYYVLYLYCIGYHFQRLVRLLLSPGHDWIEMGSHHVITMFLLMVSIEGNYLRIGIVVLMVNDVSDIFVYIAKGVSIMESQSILVAFPLLMITWAYWRIHQFATVVIPMANMHPAGCDICRTSVYGMWCLIALNVFWFTIFIRMAVRLVTRGDKRDISTDDKKEWSGSANNNNNNTPGGVAGGSVESHHHHHHHHHHHASPAAATTQHARTSSGVDTSKRKK